jgi:hypothetical protein
MIMLVAVPDAPESTNRAWIIEVVASMVGLPTAIAPHFARDRLELEVADPEPSDVPAALSRCTCAAMRSDEDIHGHTHANRTPSRVVSAGTAFGSVRHQT